MLDLQPIKGRLGALDDPKVGSHSCTLIRETLIEDDVPALVAEVERQARVIDLLSSALQMSGHIDKEKLMASLESESDPR